MLPIPAQQEKGMPGLRSQKDLSSVGGRTYGHVTGSSADQEGIAKHAGGGMFAVSVGQDQVMSGSRDWENAQGWVLLR